MKTPELEELLGTAKDAKMTEDEKEEQRRDWAFGNVLLSNPAVTREMVNEAAARLILEKTNPPKIKSSGLDVREQCVDAAGVNESVEGVASVPPNYALVAWTVFSLTFFGLFIAEAYELASKLLPLVRP